MSNHRKTQKAVRRPLQQRSRQSVAAIVEASAQVLEEWGYKGATTNRIASRAGVSVGSLYQYFRDKDEIFDALIDKESRAYLAAVASEIPREKIPLDKAIRRLLEAGYAHHELVVGIREVIRYTPAEFYECRLLKVRSELHCLAVRFLQSQQPLSEGLDDIDQAAEVIIVLCLGMTLYARVDYAPEQLVEILAEALGRYLGVAK